MKRAAKGHALQVVTANALRSGSVVFRTAQGDWSLDIADAAIAETAEAGEILLAAAAQDVAADMVVEAYLVDVERLAEGPRPLLLRERIRALRGPTITENRTLPPAPAGDGLLKAAC
ncbi:DUF2849 domain-containing protein [Camelimonas sp. ID_303_24]